jgi:hypothetical protein
LKFGQFYRKITPNFIERRNLLMFGKFYRGKWFLAFIVLLIASLACTLSSPQGPEEDPDVVTVVVTATEVPPTEAPDESSASATINQDLNVRSGPGTAYPVQDQLPGGTTVDILGKNEGGTWWLISYGGGTGWVSEPFTESSNTESVPVVAAPPVPSSSSGGSSSGGSSSGSSSSGGSSSGGSSSSSGSSSGGGGGGAPSDKDISTSVSVKNGSASYSGEISYPNGDTEDKVTVKPTGFDSIKTSGNLIFTLTCSGGNAKVKYTGGSVTNGSPGCNKTWTVFVTNVSASSTVRIYLDSNGSVNWNLVIAGGG